MKKLALWLILAIYSPIIYAQSSDTLIYVSVLKNPQYPGGMYAFQEFIGKNIFFPDELNQSKEDVRIFVNFVIEKDGSVSNVQAKFLNFECQKCLESIEKAYLKSEKWIAGGNARGALRVKFNMLIYYSPSQKSFYYLQNKPNLNKSDTNRVKVYVKPD